MEGTYRGWVEITRAHSSLAGLHQAPSRGFFTLFLVHPGRVTVTSFPGEELKHREEKQPWRWSQVPYSLLEFIFLTPLARFTFFFIRISLPLCICYQGAHVSPRSLGSHLGLMLLFLSKALPSLLGHLTEDQAPSAGNHPGSLFSLSQRMIHWDSVILRKREFTHPRNKGPDPVSSPAMLPGALLPELASWRTR